MCKCRAAVVVPKVGARATSTNPKMVWQSPCNSWQSIAHRMRLVSPVSVFLRAAGSCRGDFTLVEDLRVRSPAGLSHSSTCGFCCGIPWGRKGPALCRERRQMLFGGLCSARFAFWYLGPGFWPYRAYAPEVVFPNSSRDRVFDWSWDKTSPAITILRTMAMGS